MWSQKFKNKLAISHESDYDEEEGKVKFWNGQEGEGGEKNDGISCRNKP